MNFDVILEGGEVTHKKVLGLWFDDRTYFKLI